MVDIKELMRTYVFINDPDVKEVTTKFGALVLGLGLATLAVWGTVSLAEDEAGLGPEAAETGDGSGDATGTSDAGTADASTTTECVPAEDEDEWRVEHQDLILANKLTDVEETGDEVCFTYET